MADGRGGPQVFSPPQLRSLSKLYANNNRLRRVPCEMGLMTTLKCLYLEHNELTVLPMSLSPVLDNLWDLDLSDNPWHSACKSCGAGALLQPAPRAGVSEDADGCAEGRPVCLVTDPGGASFSGAGELRAPCAARSAPPEPGVYCIESRMAQAAPWSSLKDMACSKIVQAGPAATLASSRAPKVQECTRW